MAADDVAETMLGKLAVQAVRDDACRQAAHIQLAENQDQYRIAVENVKPAPVDAETKSTPVQKRTSDKETSGTPQPKKRRCTKDVKYDERHIDKVRHKNADLVPQGVSKHTFVAA